MRLLVVEDSLVVRRYVEAALAQAPDVELLPAATDGEAGVRAAVALRPDVILMDLQLPRLDGMSAIARIMDEAPCPIVVFSAFLQSATGDRTFEALRAGAVEVIAKPQGLGAAEVGQFREELLRTLKLMAQARVVRRRAPAAVAPPKVQVTGEAELVVIGSSTGGPEVLHRIFRALPAPFPLPIVLAQHIIPGFEHGLAKWLSGTGHAAEVVAGPTTLEPGRVLIAPAHAHLQLTRGLASQLAAEPGALTPSVDVLFESAAAAYGGRVAALLLTGMGEDGARGLRCLRELGAATATQLGESCVVDGMPAAGRRLGGSLVELAPDAIPAWLGAQASPSLERGVK